MDPRTRIGRPRNTRRRADAADLDRYRAAKPEHADADHRAARARIALALLSTGGALQLPELLVARHDLRQLTHRLDTASLLLSLLGALSVGGAAAGLFLRRRARGRRATAGAATAAIALGLLGFVLACVAPPPFITSYPRAGVLTLANTLSTLYTVLIVGAAAAALVLTARHLQQAARSRTAG